MAKDYVEFELWGDGERVASVSGDPAYASQQILFYALIYSQDCSALEIREIS